MIATLGALISTLGVVGFILAVGIPFTSAVFMAVTISTVLGVMISASAIRIFKNNTSKSKTSLKKLGENYKIFLTNTTPAISVALIVFVVAALIMPPILTTIIYLIVLGLMLNLAITYLLVMPGYYIVDLLFSFTDSRNKK
jgi:hypothetical protein